MIKINKHIEIVRSTKSGLSSMSQESCDAILAVLAKHYVNVGVSVVNDLVGLGTLVARRPDLVFLGMKFLPLNPTLGHRDPVKIWITQHLDANSISYTGSGPMAHDLELNKHLGKQRALDVGLDTSPFYLAVQNEQQVRDDMPLTFPLFVKPSNRGGGLGIDSDSVAHNFEQLYSKIQSITTDQQSDSLVEEYLPGREFSVAVLKAEHSDEFAVMPIELIAPLDKSGIRILSAQVKSADSESFIELTDKHIKARVTALAINVFHAIGARDYGRIDIRLDKTGTPQFLEANLLPSLINGYGNFPKACLLNIGMDYERMILSIVRLGLKRSDDIADELLDDNQLIVPSFETALKPA